MKAYRLGLSIIAGLSLVILSLMLLFNDDTQAQSSTRYITLLSSSQRTATVNTADQVNIQQNLNVRGVLVTLDVTGILTSPRITPSIQIKDPASSKYEDVLVASSGVTAVGTHSYLLYPGAGSAAADITQVADFPLGHVWRVSIAHDDTDPITYSVGANLLP